MRAVLRDALTTEDQAYILQRIQELKQKFQITQDGVTYFRKIVNGYDDVGPCSAFYINLLRYKSYFSVLDYTSVIEGVMHRSL